MIEAMNDGGWLPYEDGATGSGVAESWDDDAVVDQALRLVADHYRETGALIGQAAPSVSTVELRRSPLGRDLRLLAVAGDGSVSPREVRAVVRRVMDLLLRPLAADDVSVPAWFAASALGRLIARAERAAYGGAGLMTPAEAGERLGVGADVIGGWLADGSLAAVADGEERPLVARDDIEQRRLVLLEFGEPGSAATGGDPGRDVVLCERRWAS